MNLRKLKISTVLINTCLHLHFISTFISPLYLRFLKMSYLQYCLSKLPPFDSSAFALSFPHETYGKINIYTCDRLDHILIERVEDAISKFCALEEPYNLYSWNTDRVLLTAHQCVTFEFVFRLEQLLQLSQAASNAEKRKQEHEEWIEYHPELIDDDSAIREAYSYQMDLIEECVKSFDLFQTAYSAFSIRFAPGGYWF